MTKSEVVNKWEEQLEYQCSFKIGWETKKDTSTLIIHVDTLDIKVDESTKFILQDSNQIIAKEGNINVLIKYVKYFVYKDEIVDSYKEINKLLQNKPSNKHALNHKIKLKLKKMKKEGKIATTEEELIYENSLIGQKNKKPNVVKTKEKKKNYPKWNTWKINESNLMHTSSTVVNLIRSSSDPHGDIYINIPKYGRVTDFKFNYVSVGTCKNKNEYINVLKTLQNVRVYKEEEGEFEKLISEYTDTGGKTWRFRIDCETHYNDFAKQYIKIEKTISKKKRAVTKPTTPKEPENPEFPRKVIVNERYTYWSNEKVNVGDTVVLPTPSWLRDVKEPTFNGNVTSLVGEYDGHCETIIRKYNTE